MMVFQEQQEQTYESESLSEVLRKAAEFVEKFQHTHNIDEVIVTSPSSGFALGEEESTNWAVIILYSDKEPV